MINKSKKKRKKTKSKDAHEKRIAFRWRDGGLFHHQPYTTLWTPGFFCPGAYYAIHRNPRKIVVARHNS
jgi:hypothetical protein